MRVLMVDDHLMFLQGLKNLLGVLEPGLETELSETARHAVEMASLVAYDLVLLDWNLEDGKGAMIIERLRDVGCKAKIVVLSGETDAALIRQAIEAGAAGFIPKRYGSQLMVSALNRVLEGQVFLPPEALQKSAAATPPRPPESDPRLSVLTERQRDVYRAATRGLPNKMIARELGITESTVKTHLTAVFAALGVRNRTEATYQASQEGLRVG